MILTKAIGSATNAVLAGPALHIPDGMLSPGIALLTWALALAVLALAARKLQAELGERLVPLMGVMAAFVFAAQMINFPVAGGTSGHFLGGVLAAVLLGPWAAMVVMAVVVGLQALVFQDGGLLAMGANILNMGLLTAAIGYGLLRLVSAAPRRVQLAQIGIAAWLAVLGAALVTSLELWLSGSAALRVVIPAMLGIHALIGLGEALITVAAVALVWRLRPDIGRGLAPAGRGWAVLGLVFALGVVLLAPLASADPDGLERVAVDLGLMAGVGEPAFKILPDYTLPRLGEGALSTILAGGLGVLAVALAAVGVAHLALQRRTALGPVAPEGVAGIGRDERGRTADRGPDLNRRSQ